MCVPVGWKCRTSGLRPRLMSTTASIGSWSAVSWAIVSRPPPPTRAAISSRCGSPSWKRTSACMTLRRRPCACAAGLTARCTLARSSGAQGGRRVVHVVVEVVALGGDPVDHRAEVDLVVPGDALDQVLLAVEEGLDQQPVRAQVHAVGLGEQVAQNSRCPPAPG